MSHRNKVLTIIIISSLIFTIAYLPPSVKAFTNVVSPLANVVCRDSCTNPIVLTSTESTLNDLLIVVSTCTSGNNAISSITDNSSPAQVWSLDKSASLSTGTTNVLLPLNPETFGSTTYVTEIWSSIVKQVASITIHVNYVSTNSGCYAASFEGNVNTGIFNNFATASFTMPNPANSVMTPYTSLITPSGSAVNNYLAFFVSIFDNTSPVGLSCPASSCNTPIPATSNLQTGIIFNDGLGRAGSSEGVGYLFSSTGASTTIGIQVQSQSWNQLAPILLVGVLFATSGSVSNCNSLICNISEAIPFNEGFGSLGNLVVQLSESIPFQEFTNFAHSLIVKLTDGFTFLEQIPLVGPIFAQQIKDSFRLLDSLCIITFSCSFVTFNPPTPRTYVLTDNAIDYFVTIFMIPAICIIAIIFLMRRGAEIPEHMVMPIALFAVLMIAWGGAGTIFPPSVSLIVILIAGAALSYYVADWFYGRFNRGAIETE